MPPIQMYEQQQQMSGYQKYANPYMSMMDLTPSQGIVEKELTKQMIAFVPLKYKIKQFLLIF